MGKENLDPTRDILQQAGGAVEAMRVAVADEISWAQANGGREVLEKKHAFLVREGAPLTDIICVETALSKLRK